MSEYEIKVGFWLRAFDSATVEAPNDAEVLAMAKAAATTIMESHAHPETIDFDERREGSISHIDRLDPNGRAEIAGFIAFDDDRLHAPLHEFIERLAALPLITDANGVTREEAAHRYDALIGEAKALRRHVA